MAEEGFRHEALLYAGEEEFMAGTLPFIRAGVAAGEPTLVVVGRAKLERLRSELGDDAAHVLFADMADVGINPARIIPAWHEFVDRRVDGSPIRGIGEPIWAGRSPAELVECQLHESLLNLAFADAHAFTLLCPYDTTTLDDAVIEEARRSHPLVVEPATSYSSDCYRGLDAISAPFDMPLPPAPEQRLELEIDGESLPFSRELLSAAAAAAGLSASRTTDLVLAANEIVTNTIRHGGGRGALRVWADDQSLVCEIEDRGFIDEPLIGRRQPAPEQQSGRGLWIANRLCELVQVRSSPAGTTIRLHVRR